MSDFLSSVQDTSLAIAVRGKTFCSGAAQTAKQRLSREDGQTAAEYMGILLVVSVIIIAIAGSGIGGDITGFIDDQISKIAGEGGGGSPAGGGGGGGGGAQE